VFTTTTTYKAFNQRLIGRFLSPDPYGQFYSAYTGMGNNPVNLVDPSGGYVKHWRIRRGEMVDDDTPPSFPDIGQVLKRYDIFVFIDFGPGPTGGGGGGGNGGSTGPGCGSGGGSGSPNSDSHLSGPPPDPDEEEETETVPRGEPDEYKTFTVSPAIPGAPAIPAAIKKVLEIYAATSFALVGSVAAVVVLTSSDTRPPEPLPEPDVVDELLMIFLVKFISNLMTGNEHYKGPWKTERPLDYIKSVRGHDNTIIFPNGSGRPIIEFILQVAGGFVLIKTFYDATEVEPVDTTQNNNVEPDVFYYEKN
jgi:hypothetical protein